MLDLLIFLFFTTVLFLICGWTYIKVSDAWTEHYERRERIRQVGEIRDLRRRLGYDQ